MGGLASPTLPRSFNICARAASKLGAARLPLVCKSEALGLLTCSPSLVSWNRTVGGNTGKPEGGGVIIVAVAVDI